MTNAINVIDCPHDFWDYAGTDVFVVAIIMIIWSTIVNGHNYHDGGNDGDVIETTAMIIK